MKALFIEPMESRAADTIPIGADWSYEVKLDGYRAEAIRHGDKTYIYSRNGNDLTRDFSDVVHELDHLPEGTIVDGEVAALDPQGRPRFNLMQNRKSAKAHVVYFAFDILMHKGKYVTKLQLSERRELLRATVRPGRHVSISEWTASADNLLRFVHEHHLEGSLRSAQTLSINRASGRAPGSRFRCTARRSLSSAATRPAISAWMR
jgi:ATP-dependent DNA ligase